MHSTNFSQVFMSHFHEAFSFIMNSDTQLLMYGGCSVTPVIQQVCIDLPFLFVLCNVSEIKTERSLNEVRLVLLCYCLCNLSRKLLNTFLEFYLLPKHFLQHIFPKTISRSIFHHSYFHIYFSFSTLHCHFEERSVSQFFTGNLIVSKLLRKKSDECEAC